MFAQTKIRYEVTYKGDLNRRYPLLDIDEPVGVHSGDQFSVEKARQFSESGMLFESARDFFQGQLVSFSFQISQTVLVRVEGEVDDVFWPLPGTKLVGARFYNPDREQIKILLQFFARKKSLK